jgi:hypothetical protein
VDYRLDPTAQRLERFLTRWLSEHPGWQWSQGTRSGWASAMRDSTRLASALLEDTEFAEVGVATWLHTPNGELVRFVVGRVLPWPVSAEFNLLVEAVTIAALAKQRQQRVFASGATVAAAVLVGAVIYGTVYRPAFIGKRA